MTATKRVRGLASGLNIMVLYLGGFKVAIVMWIYGVRRFSTDIHFWLGFKPTKFWVLSWMILPIILMLFLVNKIYYLTEVTQLTYLIMTIIWIIFSLFVVHYIQFKTIAKYMVRNNLAGALSCNKRYGPTDPDDRKRRVNYNETMRLKQCKHNCNILEEQFDCNHLPIVTKPQTFHKTSSSNSEMSMTSIFEPSTSNRAKPTFSTIHVLEDN